MGSRLLLAVFALAAAGLLVFLLGTGSDPAQPAGPADPSPAEPGPEPEAPEAGSSPVAVEQDPVAKPGDGVIRVVAVREDDSPVAGATVRAGAARAETDAAGEAVLEGLEVGDRPLVRVEGPESMDVPAEDRVRVASGDEPPARFVIRQGGAVTGAVVDPSGAPIPTAYEVGLSRLPDNLPRGIDFGAVSGFAGRAGRRTDFPAGTSTFEVPGVRPGRYVATATAEGWVTGTSEPFEVGKGAVTRDVTISVARGGRVSGLVLRGLTGEPVAGAQVSLARDRGGMNLRIGGNLVTGGAHSGKTDDQGRFTLSGVEPGEYVLHASAKDLAAAELAEVVVTESRDTTGLLVRLGEGGSITGTVYDDAGEPVPGAEVLIQPAQPSGITIIGDFGDRVKANDAGVYLVEHVTPGRYRVKRPSGGSGSAIVSMRVGISGGGEPEEAPDDGTTVLVREGRVSRFDVRSSPVAGIRGRLVDEDGEPVREQVQLVEVDVDEPEPSGGTPTFRIPRFTMPDGEGRFEFTGIETGTWRVVGGGASAEVTIGPGEVREVELVARQSSVSGVVVDETGRPAAGVRVHFERIRSEGSTMTFGTVGRNIRTDEDGRFRAPRVNAGRYRVRAERGQAKGRSAEFEVEAGRDVRDVQVQLETTTDVVFEVRDASGEPVAGAFVSARRENEFGAAARTDERGLATLSLLPGAWQVMVARSGDRSGPPWQGEVVVGRGGAQKEFVSLE